MGLQITDIAAAVSIADVLIKLVIWLAKHSHRRPYVLKFRASEQR